MAGHVQIDRQFQFGHSGTPVTLSRRMRFAEMSRKRRSTIFSREELVGVKWMTNRGCRASHACTSGLVCVPNRIERQGRLLHWR